MNVRDLMTPSPACCTPDVTAAEVARLMEQHDCGAIPVVEDGQSFRIVGMVTDRDLAIRGLAKGKGGDARVADLMTADVVTARGDDDVEDVARLMASRKVRRIPVVDEDGCCIGLVAQADLARADSAVSDREVGRVVEEISEPGASH